MTREEIIKSIDGWITKLYELGMSSVNNINRVYRRCGLSENPVVPFSSDEKIYLTHINENPGISFEDFTEYAVKFLPETTDGGNAMRVELALDALEEKLRQYYDASKASLDKLSEMVKGGQESGPEPEGDDENEESSEAKDPAPEGQGGTSPEATYTAVETIKPVSYKTVAISLSQKKANKLVWIINFILRANVEGRLPIDGIKRFNIQTGGYTDDIQIAQSDITGFINDATVRRFQQAGDQILTQSALNGKRFSAYVIEGVLDELSAAAQTIVDHITEMENSLDALNEHIIAEKKEAMRVSNEFPQKFEFFVLRPVTAISFSGEFGKNALSSYAVALATLSMKVTDCVLLVSALKATASDVPISIYDDEIVDRDSLNPNRY